jgi:hypothetical protein
MSLCSGAGFRLCSANLKLHRILRRFSGGQNEGISTLEKFATSAFCPLRPLRLCVFAFKCLLVAAPPRWGFAFYAFGPQKILTKSKQLKRPIASAKLIAPPRLS